MINRNEIMKLFDEKRSMTEEKVKAGIEENRKGWCKINITDEDGKPISGIKIKAKQKTHEFRFGANLFMLDELESEEKNQKYKDYFKNLFNMATLPFYWDALEPEKGKQRYAADSPKIYRRPAPDLCIDFYEKNGIEPREHALAYEHFFPEWLKGKSSFEVKRELSRRMKEVAERYGDKIRTMEITNEMDWGVGCGVTDFYEDNDYIEWCFKEAEKHMGANQLVINEWTGWIWENKGRNRDPYYMQIENALLKGARIDAIGMQFHMFNRAEDAVERTRKTYDPEQLYRITDRYSDFNLPLQVTEVTIPAYSCEESDEELQAEILRNLYSIWFSQKNVEQIIYWNLVDGYAHAAQQGDMTAGENYYYGGLVRFDLTKKPAYNMLENLIKKEWHTETEITADANGKAAFKGFYGGYELEITADGKKINKTLNFTKNNVGEFEIKL